VTASPRARVLLGSHFAAVALGIMARAHVHLARERVHRHSAAAFA
jgi:hypothetical protein